MLLGVHVVDPCHTNHSIYKGKKLNIQLSKILCLYFQHHNTRLKKSKKMQQYADIYC